MRVLVTGGTGFLGSPLGEELRRRGHEVAACGRRDGDLSEPGLAERLIERHRPDILVHLAARVGRLAGESDPAETVRQNAGMTLLVARACAAAGTRLAYGSTSEVYGNRGDSAALEDEPITVLPESVYGLSKRWGEEAARLTCPDVMLLRFSGPYGPGTAPSRGRGAIQTMLDQARAGQPIPAFRDVERSWCWIGDAVEGAALVLEHGETGAWNVGRDDAHVSMADAARLACRAAGAPGELVEEVDPPAGLAARHRISTAKLESLGWRPTVDLEEGMRRTLEWLGSGG
jgi:nucleoside-diphosphate-sugar epimerase